jgi:organic radical activating enzyme
MKILFISLISSCNRSCYYCPVKKWLRPLDGTPTEDDIKNNRPKVNTLNNDALFKWLDAYIRPDEWIIELTGGEPGLYPGIAELVMGLADRGFKGLVKTNGSLPIPITDNFQLITAWHEGVENIPEYYDQIVIIKNPKDDWQKKVEYCETHGIPYQTVLFDRKFEGKGNEAVLLNLNKTLECLHISSSGMITGCSALPMIPGMDIFSMAPPIPNTTLSHSCPRCKNINDVELFLPPELRERLERDYENYIKKFSAAAGEPTAVQRKKERTYQERILVGLTGRYIENETVKSVFKAVKKYPNAVLEIADGYGIASNRNILANKAVDEGFEYLLFIDNDIVAPENAVDDLLDCLERTDTSVASGWYNLRQHKDCVSAARYYKDRNFYEAYYSGEWENEGREFVKIAASGLGLALVKTDIFRKISYPYFNFVEYENKSVLSEDLFFFDALRRIGETSYAVRGLKADHIKKMAI